MSDSIKLHTMDLFSRFFQENQEKFLTLLIPTSKIKRKRKTC